MGKGYSMATLSSIKRLHRLVEHNLFMITGTLDYMRTIDAIAALSEAIEAYQGEGENIWYLEGIGCAGPDDIIAGSYCHLVEWHGGQFSRTYEVSCILGRIFNPGMSDGPETESCEHEVYLQLQDMAEGYHSNAYAS